MLLYVDGDKPAAVKKLAVAAAQNSPADLNQLAKALDEIKSVPGAADYVAALDEAMSVLVQNAGQSPVSTTSSEAPSPSTAQECRPEGPGTQSVLTADTDPKQALRTVEEDLDTGPQIGWCRDLAGAAATCRTTLRGPAFLTDLESLGEVCTGQFVAITQGRKAQLVLHGPFHLHGARLLLNEGEALVVGQRVEQPPAETSSGNPSTASGTSPAKAPARERGAKAPQPVRSAPETEPQEAVTLTESDPSRECNLLWSGFRPYGSGQEIVRSGP